MLAQGRILFLRALKVVRIKVWTLTAGCCHGRTLCRKPSESRLTDAFDRKSQPCGRTDVKRGKLTRERQDHSTVESPDTDALSLWTWDKAVVISDMSSYQGKGPTAPKIHAVFANSSPGVVILYVVMTGV